MQKLKKFSIAPFAIMLITASIHGYAQNVDCLFCHGPNGVSGVRDVSQYYIHPPDGHPIGRGFHFNHPVGLKYPAAGLSAGQEMNCFARPVVRTRKSRPESGLSACQNKFNSPNGQSVGIVFFDRNGNGQPDSDEIQLFAEIDDVTGEVIGENGDVTVECSSCHKAHGNDPASGNTPNNFYLRINNKGSALCLTCHNK